jgi:anti-sigma B factor antagonist
LHRATEIDDAGREALLALLLTPKGGGEGVVSLEGLDVTILDLSGRLVFGQEHDFLLRTIKRLLSEGKKKILMNMAGVSYTDSGGRGGLVGAYSTVRQSGGTVKLLNLTQNPENRDLLNIAKLVSIFDVFENEAAALESFGSPLWRCHCPVCGHLTGPPLMNQDSWPPQACSRCNSMFTVTSSHPSREEVLIKGVRIQTYRDEYFEILSGPPVTVQVVGRLDLFSSSALKKVWQAISGWIAI